MNKKYLLFISLFGVVLTVWLITFIPNAKLANVIGNGEIKEELDYGDYKIVFTATPEYITGDVYRNSLWGWKLDTSSSPAVNDKNLNIYEHIFRTSNISGIAVDGQGYLYGYVNPNKVKAIRFQTEEMDYLLKVKDYFWYIPIKEKDLSFNAEQFSVILTNGNEIFYPFEEID